MNRPNDQQRGPFRGGFHPPPPPPPPPFRGGGSDANRGRGGGGRFGNAPGHFRDRGGMVSHPSPQRGHMSGVRGPAPGRERMNGGAMPQMRPHVPSSRGGGRHVPGNLIPGRGRGGPMIGNPPMDNFRTGGRPIPPPTHGLGRGGGGVLPHPPPPPPGRFGRRPGNNFLRSRVPPPPPPPPPPPAAAVVFGGGFAGGPVPGRGVLSTMPHLGPQQQQQYAMPGQMPVPALPSPYSTIKPITQIFTKEQLDAAWTEHTSPEGVKYYHNALSKESTYVKPEALVLNQASSIPNQTLKKLQWKEYTDPSTGKIYYSNGISTQWTRPDEMGNGINKEQSDPLSIVPNETNKDTTSSKKRKRLEINYKSKEEAIAGFKDFLLSKEVAPGLKWSEVVKSLSHDDHWAAMEAHLSTGERKQALAEYQTKRANDIRTLQRQERQRAKEAFQRMLTEILPSVEVFSAWNSKWKDIRTFLLKDKRFESIDDEGTRETLFVDFCEEFRKRDDRRRRAMKHEAEENFVALLKEFQKEGRISVMSTWHSFHASLTELERADARLVLSDQMDEADQKHLFADYIAEIQQAEDDEKRRSHEERRQAERLRRENYRKLLVRFAEENKLTPSSLWRDSQNLLNQDPSSAPLAQQDPQAPREMFQRFIDDWNSAYLGDRRTLSQLAAYLPKKSTFVNDETTYEEFVKALLDVSSNDDQLNMEIRRIVDERSPVSSAKLYFDELRNRAKLAATARRGSSRRQDEESSEDEGEIDE